MLPIEIESLIFEYLEEIYIFLNLPKYKAVKRLVKKSNNYILKCLGFVLDLPPDDLVRIKYRISFETNFVFYFRLTPLQRIHLITLIEQGITWDLATSNLVWLFVLNTPRLLDHPRYRGLFVNSLLCTMLGRVRSLHVLF